MRTARTAAALAMALALVTTPVRAADPPTKPATGRLADEDPRDTVRRDRAVLCSQATGGNSEAAFRMARRNLLGLGVRRDPRKGVSWLRVAAAMGHFEARRLLQHVPAAMGRMPPTCDGGVMAGERRGLNTPPPEVIKAMVERLAPTYGLDPELVLAVMRIESSFRPEVISPKAAAGLMQLIPATAERFGVEDVFDPEDNARGGMKYLRWLLSYFRGDVIFATAGYNAGERAVDRNGGVPPYAETQRYVAMIRKLYGKERHPFDPAVAPASPLVGDKKTRSEKRPAP